MSDFIKHILCNENIAIRGYSIIMVLLSMALVFSVIFLLFGCSTTEDREMMEWEGTYECVLMAGGGAFCK